MRFKKRGISSIIATVLLIMLTVVSVGIIAQFLVPYARDNLKKGTECLPFRDYFKFEEFLDYNNQVYRFNCKSGNLYGFSVRSMKTDSYSSENASGFNIVFKNNEKSVPFRVIEGNAASSLPGNVRMLNPGITIIQLPKNGEVKTYVYNSNEDFTDIEIYPILRSGKTCEKTDSIKIITCEPHVSLGAT